MEFQPQAKRVRLKSGERQLDRFTSMYRDGRVLCNWVEPGDYKWRGDWFHPDQLEEVHDDSTI